MLLQKARNSKVLVLGGTGRIGGSIAISLSKISSSLRLVIAGRNRACGDSLVSTIGENSEFLEVDIDDVNKLQEALDGPFQQEEKCNVLEAAINTKLWQQNWFVQQEMMNLLNLRS